MGSKYPIGRCMFDLVGQLSTTAARYAEHRQLSLARVSALVFGNGNKLPAVVHGADLTTRSWERAMCSFSHHWPEGASWPEDVLRPPTSEVGSKAMPPDSS